MFHVFPRNVEKRAHCCFFLFDLRTTDSRIAFHTHTHTQSRIRCIQNVAGYYISEQLNSSNTNYTLRSKSKRCYRWMENILSELNSLPTIQCQLCAQQKRTKPCRCVVCSLFLDIQSACSLQFSGSYRNHDTFTSQKAKQKGTKTT